MNAKVTVQYIQEQPQLIQKPQGSEEHHHILLNTTQDDLEIENVEYLEDNTNVDEYIDEHSEKYDFEDSFYPNAIHCLLDLYKVKYDGLSIEGTDIKVANVWRDVAKNMQESFFEFNERQIQQKFLLLREQYFSLQTKEDIENFDYFEQLHDIYRDPGRENINKGLTTAKHENVFYKDEILLNPIHLETDNAHLHHFKSDEIVHKEHEFIDMVEKELQAMEDGININENVNLNDKEPSVNVCNTDTVEPSLEVTTESIKNPLNKKEATEEPPKKKAKLIEYLNIDENEHKDFSEDNSKGFSLFQYNQQQERRHREKMSLLEKSLQIQEHALEQQQKLLQELIKRLPS